VRRRPVLRTVWPRSAPLRPREREGLLAAGDRFPLVLARSFFLSTSAMKEKTGQTLQVWNDWLVAGVDTVRGIAYQQWRAVIEAIALLENPVGVALRVEGMHDVVDIEILDQKSNPLRALQVKTRAAGYTWGHSELITVLLRWGALPGASSATFEFVTNGRLGTTGEVLRDALDQARAGSVGALAHLLKAEPTSPICAGLRGAYIRIDPALAGELAGRAIRDVMAMLPTAHTAVDAEDEAQNKVLLLFQALLGRAERPDPHDRVVTRIEIAQILGVAIDQRRSLRWPGELRDRYLRSAKGWRPSTRANSYHEVERLIVVDGESTPQTVTALLAGPTAILVGRTGSGKSTSGARLVRQAACEGVAVVPAAAEAYVPGRLAALVADSMAVVLGEPVSVSAGVHVLADTGVTLVIDGASEMSRAARDALRDELRSPSSLGVGASVVAVGRDLTALRSLFPATRSVPVFSLPDLDASQRAYIAGGILQKAGNDDPQAGKKSELVDGLVAQIGAALGDAAGNPMLFTMAGELIVAGVQFTDVIELYRSFVEQLAERTHTEGIAVVARGLGVVFAGLLNEQRRSADPYTWAVRLEEAARTLRPLDAEAGELNRGARQAGLVYAVGVSQVVVPLHDSFADYLAAAAHADGLAALPDTFRASDEQRVLFCNMIRPLSHREIVAVARDLPLLTVRLARASREALEADAPTQIAEILMALLPPGTSSVVSLWRAPGGRVVAFRGAAAASSWVGEHEGRALFQRFQSAVSSGGSVAIAIALWRLFLRHALARTGELPVKSPRSLSEAVNALQRHLDERRGRITALVGATFTKSAAAQIYAALGPLGLEADVYPRTTDDVHSYFPVSYRPSGATDVRSREAADAGDLPRMLGRTSVEGLVAESSHDHAVKVVLKAVNALANEPADWL
jgi:hypothetical protein